MIISLEKIREGNLPFVGNKAFGLARMKQMGLNVPPGYCITVIAFQKHIASNNLANKIGSALDKLNTASLEERKPILLEIRQAIINAPLADSLRSELENHYQAFANCCVAVRSSATAEDLPGHSFAGQYETYLGVTGLSNYIEAIKKCWASLWTERAYDYRQNNSIDHMTLDMAVIVQSLVEADASGVIFTADPVNGYKSRIVIETVPGLGDRLVSGEATPQRFVIAKRKYRIVCKNMTVEPCITDPMVKKLAKLGNKIEKYFGCPQDIEWAISNNKIFFLQSRPITAIPQQKSWEDRQAWTNGNAGEVAPDVMTPITWSVIQSAFKPFFRSVLRFFCVDVGDNPVTGLVAGRIYFNINTGMGAIRHLPGWQKIDFSAALGGEHNKVYELGQLDIPEEDVPDIRGSFLRMLLKLPVALPPLLFYKSQKAQALLDKMASKNKQLRSLDTSAMADEKLAERSEAIVTEDLHAWDAKFLMCAMYPFPFFYTICNKWLGDNDIGIANRLLSGLSGMDDANAGLDLWRLAQKAHEDAETEKSVLGNDKWLTVRAKLSKAEAGREFLKMWDAFMSHHGHHCRGELELFNQRWFERPDFILSLVRNYLSSIEQLDVLENSRKLALEREKLAEDCRQQLKNPIKRCLFNYSLQKAQLGSVMRENFKSEIVRQLAELRKMLIELGQRLNKKGIIENKDDIFFLEIEEIRPVTENKAAFDVKDVIASRRKEYEKNKTVTPPKVVIGKFDPDNFVPENVDADIEVLNGVSASPGVVTGKARVILKANTDEQVLAGEILVAPFTDPGWTPYFIPAAAIVMDMGGILSHGSVVAREYGIPAVVNVGPATKIIKTGQTIQVDANRGIVKILKDK